MQIRLLFTILTINVTNFAQDSYTCIPELKNKQSNAGVGRNDQVKKRMKILNK